MAMPFSFLGMFAVKLTLVLVVIAGLACLIGGAGVIAAVVLLGMGIAWAIRRLHAPASAPMGSARQRPDRGVSSPLAPAPEGYARAPRTEGRPDPRIAVDPRGLVTAAEAFPDVRQPRLRPVEADSCPRMGPRSGPARVDGVDAPDERLVLARYRASRRQ